MIGSEESARALGVALARAWWLREVSGRGGTPREVSALVAAEIARVWAPPQIDQARARSADDARATWLRDAHVRYVEGWAACRDAALAESRAKIGGAS